MKRVKRAVNSVDLVFKSISITCAAVKYTLTNIMN